MSRSVPLTESQILYAAHVDSLYHVKNINFWGRDISDVSVMNRLPNVEVISLSINKITTLRDFQNCYKLRELYVRKNEIADYHEIDYLVDLPNLRVLWLEENPCCQINGFYQYVLNKLPNLTRLDKHDITDKDRQTAQLLGLPANVIEERGNKNELDRRDEKRRDNVEREIENGRETEREREKQKEQERERERERERDNRRKREAEERERDRERDRERERQRENLERDKERERQREIEKRRPVTANPFAGYASSSSVSTSSSRSSSQHTSPSSSPSPPSSSSVPSSRKHVLYAVLALLHDLSVDELLMVNEEINQRLTKARIAAEQQALTHHHHSPGLSGGDDEHDNHE